MRPHLFELSQWRLLQIAVISLRSCFCCFALWRPLYASKQQITFPVADNPERSGFCYVQFRVFRWYSVTDPVNIAMWQLQGVTPLRDVSVIPKRYRAIRYDRLLSRCCTSAEKCKNFVLVLVIVRFFCGQTEIRCLMLVRLLNVKDTLCICLSENDDSTTTIRHGIFFW